MKNTEQNRALSYHAPGGGSVSTCCHSGICETIISAACGPNESLLDFLDRIKATAVPPGSTIINQDIFGPSNFVQAIENSDHPVTWIQPDDRNKVGCLVATLRAGQMLYLPASWFHEVRLKGQVS